jgi:signal transduction histidine kinase
MASGSVFHKESVGGWLFLGATAIAVFSATFATAQLQSWANRTANHQLQLSRLQATTNRLDALEWRAIAQLKIDADLQALLEEQREQSETILAELKGTAPSPEDLQEVTSAYEQYVEAVNQLLTLLKMGEMAEALELDEAKVDPSYEELHETVVRESAEATDIVKRVGTYTFWGAILTSLALIAVISEVFRQYRQSNRKAQLILLEQEGMRRSEQVLRQERAFLETKVIERTQALEEKNTALTQALFDLQQSQLQLIQSEKMSSLGQLVAGVAHEINNPVSFIHGNVTHATQYTQSLIQLLDLYQSEYAHPTAAITTKIEAIDLTFLKQDIQKIFSSMKMGTKRIQAIVLSLRNFSRLDESEFKVADLHEGIDNTLVILASRLKAVDYRPEIQVMKCYGNLPCIECYAGQLNQVFMNLLSNALDALEESGRGLTYEEIERHPYLIKIQTELIDSDQVKITIEDNGSGIPEEIRSRLFDPFFTTKPVGKGTGLGLSISYQIITEKHKGRLYCDSTVGEGTKFYIKIPVRH